MRKLEGAAFKKTMAELKKEKNSDMTKVKNKTPLLKKSGIVKKNKKDSPLKSGVVGIREKVTINGRIESKNLTFSNSNIKEETNCGAKLLEDESDPYCPDFDEEPAFLPLIGRKLNLKPVFNSIDNCVSQDLSPPTLAPEVQHLNGDIKENLVVGSNAGASTSSSMSEALVNGDALTENHSNNSSPSKPKKKKVKAEGAAAVNGIKKENPKIKKKRKEPSDKSADHACSPPKKKKTSKLTIACVECNKCFSSDMIFKRHLKFCKLNEEERHRLLPHQCTECEYRSAKKAMVTRHLETHGIYKCVKCSYVGDNKEAFRQHNASEHKDRTDMKLCRVCSRYIKCDTTTLDEHMKTCQGKMPLFCPECKKEFKYESSLSVHLNSHYPDRPKKFACDVCDYKSNYKANLQKHVSCMHVSRERAVKCQDCEKLFYSDEAMRRHAKIHVDQVFVCPICNFSCNSTVGLGNHMEKHKPKYSCPVEECNEKFQTSQELKKHKFDIHKITLKSFICKQKGCKLSFLKRSHLRRHETTHTGERKYRCEWEGCGKAFRHADNLKVHMRQHTNENPVKCDLCDFTCKQKSSLKWHMGKQHPEPQVYTDVNIEQDDAAFWQAVMAVIGPDGEGLAGTNIDTSSIPLKDSKSKRKSNSKKKKPSDSEKKKGKSDKMSKSKKKKKKSCAVKTEGNSEATESVAINNTTDTALETTQNKPVKSLKRKSSTCKLKSKSKSKRGKHKGDAGSEVKDSSEQTDAKERDGVSVKVEPTDNSEVPINSESPIKTKKTPVKGGRVSKGKKLSKSKAHKVAKCKGVGAAKKSKKKSISVAKKSPKAAVKKSKRKASVADSTVDAVAEDENVTEKPVGRKRKRGKVEDEKDVAPSKAKKTKKNTKSTKAKKSPKSKAKKKTKQVKAPKKTAEEPEKEEAEDEVEEAPLTTEDNADKIVETEPPEQDTVEAIESQPPEDLDSDSDVWANTGDNNTPDEPDRNCDADDERDLDNDDEVDKISESGFLGDVNKTAEPKLPVDDDARSRVSDGNNSISDVASLDDAIPDTPPRAPMRLDDNQEEVDENDYYEPPPSPPPINSVDQASIERQDSEQTVLDNSLPHSNNTQDILSEEAVVQDSIKPTLENVHTPQSQQPEALPPNDKDYFGQYLQVLPAVEAPPSVPAVNQDGSPENLTNFPIPSGAVEGGTEEIKALDLRPEPVSTITHTRLQRETVTGMANANIERETVSTITHTSRTVQPVVTQPSCIPVQTDVMSYQRMELLACGRPENIMQQKESSLQRLTSITYQNFGSLDSVNPTCRDMNYLRPAENMFPRSCAAGGGFMRVTDGESSLGRAGMNSLLRQPDTTFARPETSVARAANPSLLRPSTEELFARDAMGRPLSRSPFHSAWTGQEIRPAHWNQNPYLQRPVERSANTATPALLGTERDFTFDPSRTIPDQNVFSNLTSQQHELSRDTPFQLERFDLSSYFSHPYSTTPALEYGHPTCGPNQKAFEDRLRQPPTVPDLRGLPQPPSTDMLNQFCGINVNPSFNLDKYMYARDPVYRPQHVAGTTDSAFLSHTAPSQPTYFSRDYTGRTLYPQSNPYALMDERQYGSASKLTHPAGVQQDRDIMGRRTTANDNQIQDPYRRSVIYNVMNRFYE